MSEDRIAELRACYAEGALRRVGVEDAALRAAFARVEREKFLGTGPWRIAESGAYRWSKTADASEVYVNALVALDADRGVNNGEPSGHALWIHALELKSGERVNHIGAGVGYYTAILAELVGLGGRVFAYEINPELAARAAANLSDRPNVEVRAVSGADRALDDADAIYVNAGASAPLPSWLDALRPGGRLVFPLTDSHGGGGMFKMTRAGDGTWPARMIGGAAFIALIGRGGDEPGRAVHDAFRGGGAAEVRWLRRDSRKSRRDWLRGAGWRLTR